MVFQEARRYHHQPSLAIVLINHLIMNAVETDAIVYVAGAIGCLKAGPRHQPALTGAGLCATDACKGVYGEVY